MGTDREGEIQGHCSAFGEMMNRMSTPNRKSAPDRMSAPNRKSAPNSTKCYLDHFAMKRNESTVTGEYLVQYPNRHIHNYYMEHHQM